MNNTTAVQTELTKAFLAGEIFLNILQAISSSINVSAIHTIYYHIHEKRPLHKLLICLSSANYIFSLSAFVAVHIHHFIMDSIHFCAEAIVSASIIMIAIDQYIAIIYPLRHIVILSHYRTKVIIIVIHATGILFGVVHFISRHFELSVSHCDDFGLTLTSLILPMVISISKLIVIGYTYIKVALEIRKISVLPAGQGTSTRSKRKGFHTALLIIGSNLVFNVPFWCSSMIHYFGGISCKIDGVLYLATYYWRMISPIVDPLIFSFRMPDIREAYRKSRQKSKTCACR